jgi:hypothetical protein
MGTRATSLVIMPGLLGGKARIFHFVKQMWMVDIHIAASIGKNGQGCIEVTVEYQAEVIYRCK